MNITVYLGANAGNDPKLQEAVEALGKWIGENGHDLIYGGSKCGLMGSIAESVLQNGGKVTGVEPQFFVDSELQHDGHRHAGGDCGSDVEGIAEAFRRAVHSL